MKYGLKYNINKASHCCYLCPLATAEQCQVRQGRQKGGGGGFHAIEPHWEEVRLGSVTRNFEPNLGERSAPSLAPPEVSFHLEDFGAPTDLTCTSYPFCTRCPPGLSLLTPITLSTTYLWCSRKHSHETN